MVELYCALFVGLLLGFIVGLKFKVVLNIGQPRRNRTGKGKG